MSNGSITTFYSYKGGVGRTLALANVGALLSRWGYRVLCIDWDLEAPGLHRYFHDWLPAPHSSGVVEWVTALGEGGRADWADHMVEVRLPGVRLPLSLIPAGRQDAAYPERMQALDWKQLYEERDLGNLLEQARAEWKQRYDLILVDSRTGLTDIGGICTIQLPDQLVLLCTANLQSLEGAVDVALRAQQGRERLGVDRGRRFSLPVATRFEVRVEYQIAQEWLHRFTEKFAPFYEEWAPRDVTAQDLLNFARVPYVPYWSFGEPLPVLTEDGRDAETITYAFETLAALVARRLTGTDGLVQGRDAYVAAAQRGPQGVPANVARSLSGPTRLGAAGVRVFYTYADKDAALCAPLERVLNQLNREGLVETWGSRRITDGQDVPIDRRAEEADLILWLLSADLMASAYADGPEWRRALQRSQAREAVVLPVLLRPVAWDQDELPAPLPRHGEAISAAAQPEQVWQLVADEIRAAIASRRQQAAQRRQMQMPGAPYDPAWYVPRPREEEAALAHLSTPGLPLVLCGPSFFGKTWLLQRLLQAAPAALDAKRVRVLALNLGSFEPSVLGNGERFFQAMALDLAKRLGQGSEKRTEALDWIAPRRSPVYALSRLMEHVIGDEDTPLLLAIDRADAIHGRDHQTDFFSMLRSWTDQANDAPWSRLRLLLTVSVSPYHLVNTHDASPFNLSDAIFLQDFEPEQILALADLHGLAVLDRQIDQLRGWIGGHPYLCRILFYAAATRGAPLDELLKDPGRTVFSEFLQRQGDRLRRDPWLLRAARGIREGVTPPPDTLDRLERYGIIAPQRPGERAPRLRYRIYEQILSGGTPPV